MKIKRYNHALQYSQIKDNLVEELEKFFVSGNFVEGPYLEDFEKAFAAYTGMSFCVGVNCGTDALILSLKAAGIKRGDEVITSCNTFHATVAAIIHAGATPVLVDADEQSFTIDINKVEEKISTKTKAILPVHMYGKAAGMTAIMEICSKHGLLCIEDAAQAHGAEHNGKKTGAFGTMGCFSFHPSKNIGAYGDAGCIVTDNKNYYDELLILRALGQKGQNHHIRVGFNSKMDAIQAILLKRKLHLLDDWNEKRQHVAHKYKQALSGTEITFQDEDENEKHVYHLFQIRTNSRNELLKYLMEREIEATIRYPEPIHKQEAFKDYSFYGGNYPVAEILSKELLCLPIRPDMSDEEIDYVALQIKKFSSQYA